MEDFDTLLWQISHKDVQVYKDEGDWYLLVNNRCRHILGDGRCGIYDDRPRICREYTNDFCEFDEPADKNFELYFDSYTSLLKYIKQRFKSWDRFAASRDKPL